VDASIRKALEHGDGWTAFNRMHRQLDPVWEEVHRILVPGGIACINIGDAVRTIRGSFALYPNHTRIVNRLVEIGFTPLPAILWRKQTNAPNKFMGSGMLPAGAYVTLEHEYILVMRKSGRREFTAPAEKKLRRESAFFWEERNAWFSDVWMDLKGSRQELERDRPRRRSGAFPFELAYRLISMLSVKTDTVVDPFAGTGTTLLAAAAAARNAIGYEIAPGFADEIAARVPHLAVAANARIADRLRDHLAFIRERQEIGKAPKYLNQPYGFPIVTRQETELFLNPVVSVSTPEPDRFEVDYADRPAPGQVWTPSTPPEHPQQPDRQLSLF
jgi:DNA modification methylase